MQDIFAEYCAYRNHSSSASRYLAGKTCDVIVDGVSYPIPKVINGYVHELILICLVYPRSLFINSLTKLKYRRQ